MLKLGSRLTRVIVPAMLVLLVAAVACEPVDHRDRAGMRFGNWFGSKLTPRSRRPKKRCLRTLVRSRAIWISN